MKTQSQKDAIKEQVSSLTARLNICVNPDEEKGLCDHIKDLEKHLSEDTDPELSAKDVMKNTIDDETKRLESPELSDIEREGITAHIADLNKKLSGQPAKAKKGFFK